MHLAILFDGERARELTLDEARAYRGDGGFLWLHQSIGPDAKLLPVTGVPEIALSALLAAETRPRCDQIEDGALLNLRGLALDPSQSDEALSSIRLWARGDKVVSTSRTGLGAIDTVARAMRAGRLLDPGDLVALLAHEISAAVDPEIAQLGDRLDECEQQLDGGDVYALRREIARVRSQAIDYRRFVAPDRDALAELSTIRVPWMTNEDRQHVREAADRFARMSEELDAIRERSALVHEQLSDMRTEMIDQRSLMIAVVAFIFLPLTFVTGLLGMNVEGIPFKDEPWAFWGVVAFCILVGLMTFAWFAAKHWLRR